MISNEISDYIKQTLANGKSEDKIREELIAFGWPENEVDEALRTFKNQTDPLPSQPSYKEETIKKFQGQISPNSYKNPVRLGKTIFLSIFIIAIIGGLYYALSLFSRTENSSKNPQPASSKNEVAPMASTTPSENEAPTSTDNQ